MNVAIDAVECDRGARCRKIDDKHVRAVAACHCAARADKRQPVVAVAAVETVIAARALQNVIASPAVDEVVAVAAVQMVVACKA
jgi:hypothetical protein